MNPGPETGLTRSVRLTRLTRLMTVRPMEVVTASPNDRFKDRCLVQGNCGFEMRGFSARQTSIEAKLNAACG